MSQAVHTTTKPEHGTTTSYVVGFLLSVVLTVIPYYLVVNHTVSGAVLLPTILGFAVLQMLVQILFFLHLGRGPKPLYNVAFFVATISIILVVVGGTMYIMKHLHYNMTPTDVTKKLAESEGISQVEGKQTGACQTTHQNHQVIIVNGTMAPFQTKARLCDTLTFISQDNISHSIAFGSHPNHVAYAGEEELPVRKGQNKTITLNQSGTYQFHDHLHPQLYGNFTVTP